MRESFKREKEGVGPEMGMATQNFSAHFARLTLSPLTYKKLSIPLNSPTLILLHWLSLDEPACYLHRYRVEYDTHTNY